MIKINSIEQIDLSHYITARIDIKNRGTPHNQLKFLYVSDDETELIFPNWFMHKDGQGTVIQSSKGVLDLKIKCINDGKLNIRLKGIDAKYKNSKRIPIFIEFTKFEVNGVSILDEHKLVSHDDFYQCNEINFKNEDIIFIHTEWCPFKI